MQQRYLLSTVIHATESTPLGNVWRTMSFDTVETAKQFFREEYNDITWDGKPLDTVGTAKESGFTIKLEATPLIRRGG